MNTLHFCIYCMHEKGTALVCTNCGLQETNYRPVPHALPVRTLLNGKYLVGRLLGSGGFGNTYLALDMDLSMKTAIKEYLPRDHASRAENDPSVRVYDGESLAQFESGLDKFIDEARALAKFTTHAGIVSVRDFFRANGTAYIVMEYVDGVTLKEYVKQKGGKIPLDTMLEVIRPLMDALREVHMAGMLHRDIAPDNIYITKDRQVKLLDFGAARQALGDVSKSLSIILKPGYAPEEQYRKRGKQGPWTDVYAVAATIYHCVSGVLPPDSLDRFDEDTLLPLSKMVKAVPKHVDDAIWNALAVRGRDRYQTMEAFQQALKLVRDVSRVLQVEIPKEPDAKRVMSQSPVVSTPNVKVQAPIPPSEPRSSGAIVANDKDSERLNDVPIRSKSKAIKTNILPKKWTWSLVSAFMLMGVSVLIWMLFVSSEPEQTVVTPPPTTPVIVDPQPDPKPAPKPIKRMPNLKGLTVSEAKAKLRTENLQVGTTKNEINDNVVKGIVLRTEPTHRTEVNDNDQVTLVISTRTVFDIEGVDLSNKKIGDRYYFSDGTGVYRIDENGELDKKISDLKGLKVESVDAPTEEITLTDDQIKYIYMSKNGTVKP
jgi:serine/threonine protein kinase